MLAFGRGLALALAALDGTEARMGMATGPVVLTHIAHGGDALPAKCVLLYLCQPSARRT